jgi:hypothetical protein
MAYDAAHLASRQALLKSRRCWICSIPGPAHGPGYWLIRWHLRRTARKIKPGEDRIKIAPATCMRAPGDEDHNNHEAVRYAGWYRPPSGDDPGQAFPPVQL